MIPIIAMTLWVSRPPEFEGRFFASGTPTIDGRADIPLGVVVRRGDATIVIAPQLELPTDQFLGLAWYAFRASSNGVGMPLSQSELECVLLSGNGIDASLEPEARAGYLTLLAARPEAFWQAAARRLAGGNCRSNGIAAVSILKSLEFYSLWVLLFRCCTHFLRSVPIAAASRQRHAADGGDPLNDHPKKRPKSGDDVSLR